jgi:hypothetical protein
VSDISNIKSKAGIFLLYEGLPSTIIESQVLSHTKRMFELGFEIEVWSFAVTSEAYALAQEELQRLTKEYSTVKIRLYRGIKPAIPFSEICNAALLLWKMHQYKIKPPFVHARTEHATAIAAIAKKFIKFKLIWDARGDAISEFHETSKGLKKYLRWLAPLKLRAISRRLLLAQENSDYAIFVSDALRRLQGGCLPDDRTAVVPCVADERLFYFSPELRAKTRTKLGYANEDVVVTYVGSTAIWQCVPETVEIIEKALHANRNTKALIVSPDYDKFKKSFKSELIDRIIFISGKLSDINAYLNASDFGILLRKPGPINHVASPVKYAEYSLAGLPVVTTDAVDQVARFGRLIENIISPDELISYALLGGDRNFRRRDIAVKARDYFARFVYDEQIKLAYNTKSERLARC